MRATFAFDTVHWTRFPFDGGSMMKALAAAFLAALIALPASLSWGGGAARPAHYPPLDYSLMAFKEQGVWYFLCEAPQYPYRIPPHYATFGPPPPACPPPLICAPPPPAVKKVH